MKRLSPWMTVLAAGAAAWLLGAALHVTALRWIGAAVAFGFASGFPVARGLGRTERPWLVVARATFLAPLLSGAAACALLALGVSARAAAPVMVGACYAAGFGGLWIGRGAGSRGALRIVPAGSSAAPPPARTPRWERRLVLWLLVLAVLALLPHALRPWVRMRSDAVFHTAVAFEIGARGVPPGDPYFAGIPLNYIWFYHGLLAVWSEAAGVAAWDLGGVMNALWLVSLGGAVYALSRAVGRPGRESFFAALFVPLGLGALFPVGLGVKVLQAFTGATAGRGELERLFSLHPFTFDQVWFVTSLFGSPPAFINKYLVMTAMGGAVTGLVWLAEALVGWARRGSSAPRRFAMAALAAFAVWVWHPGIGGAAVLAMVVAGAFLLARPGPVPRGLVAKGALAFAAGSALAAPWLLQSVGRAESPFPIGWSPAWAGILVGSAAALALGLPALLRLRPCPGARVFQALALGAMAAALFTVLPPPNTGDKMPFVFYLFPAAAAGWMLARAWRALRSRRRGGWAWALTLTLCVPMTALTLAVYLFEPAPAPPTADARALDAWLAERTPADAVFVDSAERAEVLVNVPRRQYWGREPYALQWGYPRREMDRRRLVRDALVGRPAGARAAVSMPVDTLGVIGALDAFVADTHAPLYALWRPEDHGGARAGTSFMGRRPDRFEVVWWNPEATVFRLRPASRAAGEP